MPQFQSLATANFLSVSRIKFSNFEWCNFPKSCNSHVNVKTIGTEVARLISQEFRIVKLEFSKSSHGVEQLQTNQGVKNFPITSKICRLIQVGNFGAYNGLLFNFDALGINRF